MHYVLYTTYRPPCYQATWFAPACAVYHESAWRALLIAGKVRRAFANETVQHDCRLQYAKSKLLQPTSRQSFEMAGIQSAVTRQQQ